MFYIHSEIEAFEQQTNELVCNFKECNLEHIMNDSEDDADTSKVGNILLLSERINHNMGSISFADKKEKLKNSKLETVKKFLEHYGSCNEWDKDKINKRTRAIAKLAYNKIWKVC